MCAVGINLTCYYVKILPQETNNSTHIANASVAMHPQFVIQTF